MRLALLIMLLIAVGCDKEPRSAMPRIPSTPVVLPSGQRLDASMSDNDLLINLGLDPELFQSEQTQGVDGFSMSYSKEGQEVWITRSLVSGVFVMAEGSEVTGAWKLGGGGT